MASSTLLLCTTKTPSSNSLTNLSFFSKPSCLFVHGKRNQEHFKVSCCMGEHNEKMNFDRRDLLLGLGGLYGAANLAPLASASDKLTDEPIPAPSLKTCSTAYIQGNIPVPYSCCPPPLPDGMAMDDVPYYEVPECSQLRVRTAAQVVDQDFIDDYNDAISIMKNLDASDPRSFQQQANIHCAYCNGAYTTVGGKDLQVHFNWLFFPFHRWYLYFYERILGSLIGESTFALPYWNWDNPDGMYFPSMFNQPNTYPDLYDTNRSVNTQNGTFMDLNYVNTEAQTATQSQLLSNNLTVMYRQMITNAPTPLTFFGEAYPMGTVPTSGFGTIENMPHTPVHLWTGTNPGTKLSNGNTSYGEDMGNFYSASIDPVFSGHHANVDRMWNIWKSFGGKRVDLTQTDWLESAFFFYDEDCNPWRVKVQDCLDTVKMGYCYAPMATPWVSYKPQKKTTKGKLDPSSVMAAESIFPLSKLDKAISFSIKRPATSRSQQEKDEKEEILKFKGIKHDNKEYLRFDVFLNADKTVNTDELDKIEYAGSYTSLPHAHNASHEFVPRVFNLAITELLEDNKLEDDATIVVTVVPKKGCQVLSIQSVNIELLDC
ncbi:Polyphenol oxidase F, chloroplastic [Capsicum chinense]|nr:Polyphenol oxidase F, chloroplastic [Capsicum chinense]